LGQGGERDRQGNGEQHKKTWGQANKKPLQEQGLEGGIDNLKEMKLMSRI
jgi:hypothetical protein